MNFLTTPPQVINIAPDSQNRACRLVQVDFLPSAMGDTETALLLERWNQQNGTLADDANHAAAELLKNSRPMLRDIQPASACVPGMEQWLILHSGPPVEQFSQLGEALQRAVVGAAIHEGLAADEAEARARLEEGRIRLDSADCHQAAAARCGVISASMPVFCVCDAESGSWAYSPLPAFGAEKLSFGNCSPAAVDAMLFVENRLTAPLREALLEHGDLDVLALLTEGLLCGDNGCARHRSSAGLFCQALLPYLTGAVPQRALLGDLLQYLMDEELVLAALLGSLRCALTAVNQLADTTLLCSLCSNGAVAAARLAGNSECWITTPLPKGLICGDELLCELFGIGSAALAGSPVVLLDCMRSEQDALTLLYAAFGAASGLDDRFQLPYAARMGAPILPDLRFLVRSCKPLHILAREQTSNKPVLLDIGLGIPIEALRILCGASV